MTAMKKETAGAAASMKTLNVRSWLEAKHPKQLAILDRFETEILSSLSSSSSSSSSGKRALSSSAANGPSSSSSTSSDRRLDMALRTIDLFKVMIGSTRWKTPAELVALLKGLGQELDSAGGRNEPIISNAVRRIIAAVREEVVNGAVSTELAAVEVASANVAESSSVTARSDPFASILWALPQQVQTIGRSGSSLSLAKEPQGSTSSSALSHHHQRHSTLIGSSAAVGGDNDEEMLMPSHLAPIFFQPSRQDLKQSIMEAIQELTADVEDVYKNICQQAPNHIHSGEIILTYGKSRTVEEFLMAAAGFDASKNNSGSSGSSPGNNSGNLKLRFTVVVVESGEGSDEQNLATSLSALGIDTCVIPVPAIYAVMARVNKVVLPAHSVLANGGLVAPSGSNLVVLAAKANAVPVVVLTGIFNLTPVFPHEQQNTLNDLLSPSFVMDYTATQTGPPRPRKPTKNKEDPDGHTNGAVANTVVDLVNPLHDYVRPQLINLYVTNVGSFQPSYIYRLLAEYYHSDDWGPF